MPATKTESINLRLGPKLKEQVEDAARECEMTTGEFVRYALADWLSRYAPDVTPHD